MILIIECKTDDEPKYLAFPNEDEGRAKWEDLKREFVEDNEGLNHFYCHLYSGTEELTKEASLVGHYA